MAKKVRFEGDFHPGDELANPDEAAVEEYGSNPEQETDDLQATVLNPLEVVAAKALAQLSMTDHLLAFVRCARDAGFLPQRDTTKGGGAPIPTRAQHTSKDVLDAGMSLLKLTGQSRVPTRAALALVKLKREGRAALEIQAMRQHQEAMEKTKEVKNIKSHAKRAIRKANLKEQVHALRDFRHRYPTRLRASAGTGGGDVRNVLEGSDDDI